MKKICVLLVLISVTLSACGGLFDSRCEVLVYIEQGLSVDDAQDIATKIRALDNILQADLKTNEEALEDFAAEHDDPAYLEGIDASDLRHRIIVVLEDRRLVEQTIAELEKISGVAEVNYRRFYA